LSKESRNNTNERMKGIGLINNFEVKGNNTKQNKKKGKKRIF
jgi:hypothetical protein